jgi:hypothetical protein
MWSYQGYFNMVTNVGTLNYTITLLSLLNSHQVARLRDVVPTLRVCLLEAWQMAVYTSKQEIDPKRGITEECLC